MAYTLVSSQLKADIRAHFPYWANIDWDGDTALVLMTTETNGGTRVAVSSELEAKRLKRAAKDWADYHGIRVYGFRA